MPEENALPIVSSPGPEAFLLTFLNPTVIAIFLMWFGGTGFVLSKILPFALPLTIPAAAAAAFFMNKLTMGTLGWLLSKMEDSTNFQEQDLIGSEAEVTVAITPGHLGEITYAVAGRRYTASARGAKENLDIKRGSHVWIRDMADGIMLVEPFLDEGAQFDAQLDQSIELSQTEKQEKD